MYGKCPKIANTSCASQQPIGQTVQMQIRILLLKKQSDQVFSVCYSNKHFVSSSPDYQYFFLRTEIEKYVFEIFKKSPYARNNISQDSSIWPELSVHWSIAGQ